MALLPIGLYFWMTYEQDLMSVPVYVAKSDIEIGTVIDDIDKYFKLVKLEEQYLINNSLTPNSAYNIIGKGTVQFVPANSQVNDKFFAEPGIIVSGDKQVFKIPQSWIYAVPSSIRRGDVVKFYEIDPNIDNSTSSLSLSSHNNDSISTYHGSVKLGSNDAILTSTVIYVKDSSNREVVDAAGSPRRYDGTSQISSIEIVCTKEDIQMLKSKVYEGFKFILVY